MVHQKPPAILISMTLFLLLRCCKAKESSHLRWEQSLQATCHRWGLVGLMNHPDKGSGITRQLILNYSFELVLFRSMRSGAVGREWLGAANAPGQALVPHLPVGCSGWIEASALVRRDPGVGRREGPDPWTSTSLGSCFIHALARQTLPPRWFSRSFCWVSQWKSESP